MRFVFDQVDQIISHEVGEVWANGTKRNRPSRKRPGRHAASPGAFKVNQVPGGVDDRSKINDCEAVGRRRGKHAISSEAVRGAIEERGGCKVPTI